MFSILLHSIFFDDHVLRYVKYSRVQRSAILPLILWGRYPGRRWYVVGEDNTLFSPLALAQWLTGRFDPFDQWFIGAKVGR